MLLGTVRKRDVHVRTGRLAEPREWQSPHPDSDEEQWWPERVSSYAIELGDDFLLFDPLSVSDELRGVPARAPPDVPVSYPCPVGCSHNR